MVSYNKIHSSIKYLINSGGQIVIRETNFDIRVGKPIITFHQRYA